MKYSRQLNLIGLVLLALSAFFFSATLSRTLWAASSSPCHQPGAFGENELIQKRMERVLREEGPYSPLLEGMGKYHYEISSKNPLTRKYFDQGLILSYGFNHAEAMFSFLEAARNDSQCAICYWGAALVLGPNINASMSLKDYEKAREFWEKALSLSSHANASTNASEKEKELIAALGVRYPLTKEEARLQEGKWDQFLEKINGDYARAMRALSQKFPEDLDIGTLAAEALMDQHPWDYWTKEGEPREWTPEIVQLLKSILKENPAHPGAHHFFIHAVEASAHPEVAVESADRLGLLTPGVGHLVHMPAHIYIRIGDYHQASLVNQKAIAADKEYLTQVKAQGLYPLAYIPHNYHFLWAAATLEGRAELTLETAEALRKMVDEKKLGQPEWAVLEHFYVTPLFSQVRFGRWAEIQNFKEPHPKLLYARGIWHYAMAISLMRTGKGEEAKAHGVSLREISEIPNLDQTYVWGRNKVSQILKIASLVVAAELAQEKGDFNEATAILKSALQREEELLYNEPADWHHPIRQILGAVWMKAGEYREAEKIYREDLKRLPKNGWSLFGLWQSLKKLGREEEAARVKNEFDKAFQFSDIGLKSSRF